MNLKIADISEALPTSDGDGVSLKRNALFDGRLDPFLMLDEIKALPEDTVGAFPIHPHRGIETFSYIIHGAMAHRDSMGNASEVKAGGIQWMHTGKGIEHAEKPSVDEKGLWGFQFWLNVPREEKYQPSLYQDMSAEQLPWKRVGHVEFKLVAGEWCLNGKKLTSAFTRLSQNAAVMDVLWQEEESIELDVDEISLGIYVIDHCVSVNKEQTLTTSELATFETNEENTKLRLTGKKGSRILVFKGKPIGEPIVHHGPFVMTTQEEIQETVSAYRRGELVTPMR